MYCLNRVRNSLQDGREARELWRMEKANSACHLRIKGIRAITLHLIKHIHIWIHVPLRRECGWARARVHVLFIMHWWDVFQSHDFLQPIQVISKTVVALVFRWSHRASQTHIILLWQGTLVTLARNRQKWQVRVSLVCVCACVLRTIDKFKMSISHKGRAPSAPPSHDTSQHTMDAEKLRSKWADTKTFSISVCYGRMGAEKMPGTGNEHHTNHNNYNKRTSPKKMH